MEEDFEWVLPEINNEEVPEFQKVNYVPSVRKTPFAKSFRRKLSPNIASLIISIFLAVGVGLLLGLLLWKMVIQQEGESLVVNKSNVVDTPTTQTEDVKKPLNSPFIAGIPALTAAVIQADVFSTREKANQRVDELESQGFAATIVETDELHYIFIGIADNINTAKTWESNLKEAGMIVYAKELPVSTKEVQFASKEEADQAIAEGALFPLLAGEAIGGIMTGKVNETVLADIGKVFDAGNETSRSEEGVAFELHSQLFSAYEGLKELQTNIGDKALLKKVQQHLLDYLSVYLGAGQ